MIKMDSKNFTYWLQGFFEISDAKKLDEKQVQIIKDHLDLVFQKVTPNRNDFPKDTTLQPNNVFEFLPKTYCGVTSLDSPTNKVLC